MKKRHLFSTALVALMLGACSESVVDQPGISGNPDGTAYISLALNLPTEPSTRAANDQFEDGTAEEYDVHNATLLLFTSGTAETEADAKFHSAYNLNLNAGVNDGNSQNQITTTHKIVQKINQIDKTQNKVYALVVLNDQDLLAVQSDNSLQVTTTAGPQTVNNGVKWSDFQGYIVGEAGNLTDLATNGLMMLNAPLATVAGGADAPTGLAVNTLASVDVNKIKETEAAAQASPAATIYVERAVAKVSVNATNASGNIEGDNALQYTILNWGLHQTNKTSYLVRNAVAGDSWWAYASNKADLANPYRFVGSNAVATNAYRTYWAKDPNYSTTTLSYGTDAFNTLAAPTLSLGSSDYCLENTFEVADQDQGKTTCVVVSAEFNNGADFYLLNRDASTIYDTEAKMKDLFKSAFLGNSESRNYLKAAVEANFVGFEGTIGAENVEVTTAVSDANVVTVTDIKVSKPGEPATSFNVAALADEFSPTAWLAAVNKATGTVELYENGVSYYPVLIKHFGDDLTPWNNGEETAPSASAIYPAPNAESNYLGRYGVLRNNWYDINVTGIRKIGYPTVPSMDFNKEDDEMESYISVEINILSWAKRTQSVEL